MARTSSTLWLGVLLMASLGGCMTWRPPPAPDLDRPAAPDGQARLEAAQDLSARAEDHEGLAAAMEAHRAVLAGDPGNYAALTALGHQSILMGAAYTPDAAGQVARYRKAMAYCEQAMLTHPGFRRRLAAGQPPWEACRELSLREMDAMLFWCTAVLYAFKDTMTFPQQVLNVRWIQRLGPFLDRMEALDRRWGGGAVDFTRSLYYGILPAALGGDPAASRERLEAAVGLGEGWLLPRWGRAKYFHVRDGDWDGFRRDLEWVAAQDPERLQGPRAWNVYFQQDARRMLADMDRILPLPTRSSTSIL
jgi:hypothetical protein